MPDGNRQSTKPATPGPTVAPTQASGPITVVR
jgi:hypothetical protein